MHSSLNHLNVHTFTDICKSKELTISFLQDLGLVPKRSDPPPLCLSCNGSMSSVAHNRYTLGWKWMCRKRKKIGQDKCTRSVNSLKDTFFENVHLSINYVVLLLFHFVKDTPVTDAHTQVSSYKEKMEGEGISITTVVDFYYFCREVCEVFSSNYSSKFGGPGKTIELDETFLTVRKYGRGN